MSRKQCLVCSKISEYYMNNIVFCGDACRRELIKCSKIDLREKIRTQQDFTMKELKQLFINVRINEHKPPVNIDKEYSMIAKLGQGGYGTVYQAECINKSNPLYGKDVAIKLMHNLIEFKTFTDELEVLHNLEEHTTKEKHMQRHILKVLDAFVYTSKKTEGNSYAIVMEFIEGPTVYDFMIYLFDEEMSYLYYPAWLTLFKEMALLIQYIHSKGVVHRDIKPENIIFRSADKFEISHNEKDLLDFVLADWGSSCGLKECPAKMMGTNVYLSPELMEMYQNSTTKQMKNNPVWSKILMDGDIWAMCTTMFTLLNGYELPWMNDDEDGSAVLKTSIRDEYYNKFKTTLYDERADIKNKQALYELFMKCFNYLPENRLTIGQLIERLDILLRDSEKQ